MAASCASTLARILFFVFIGAADLAYGGTSLLGVGGGGGGMPKGVSFNLDTLSDKRVTRVHGNGIRLDMDTVEVQTGGGKLKFTPTHTEFETGLTRWITTMSPIKMSFHNNEKPIVTLYVPEDDTPYYYLAMPTVNAGIHDVIMDKALTNGVLVNLCVAEKLVYHATYFGGGGALAEAAARDGAEHDVEAEAAVPDEGAADEEGGDGTTGSQKKASNQALVSLMADLEANNERYRAECEQEMAAAASRSNTKTPPAPSKAAEASELGFPLPPQIPSHVQSLAQLLDYNSRVLIQLMNKVEVVVHDSNNMEGIEAAMKSYQAKTMSDLQNLENNFQFALDSTLVTMNDTMHSQFDEVNATLGSLAASTSESLSEAKEETATAIAASANATTASVHSYIEANVTQPLRVEFNESLAAVVEALTTSMGALNNGTQTHLTYSISANLTDLMDVKVNSTAARVLEIVRRNHSAVLNRTMHSLVSSVNQSLYEVVLRNLTDANNEVANRTDALHALQEDRLDALNKTLDVTAEQWRSTLRNGMGNVTVVVRNVNDTLHSLVNEVIRGEIIANASRLSANIMESISKTANDTLRTTERRLNSTAGVLNTTLTKLISDTAGALIGNLSLVNSSLHGGLQDVNASLRVLIGDKIGTLDEQVSKRISEGVLIPLYGKMGALANETTESFAAVNATLRDMAVSTESAILTGMSDIRRDVAGNLTAMNASAAAQQLALMTAINSTTAMVEANNAATTEHLQAMNASLAEQLVGVQTTLQSDVSSVHLLLTMVNYTIMEEVVGGQLWGAIKQNNDSIRGVLDSLNSTLGSASLNASKGLNALQREVGDNWANTTATIVQRTEEYRAGIAGAGSRIDSVNASLGAQLQAVNKSCAELVQNATNHANASLSHVRSRFSAAIHSLNQSVMAHIESNYSRLYSDFHSWRDVDWANYRQATEEKFVQVGAQSTSGLAALSSHIAANVSTPLRNLTRSLDANVSTLWSHLNDLEKVSLHGVNSSLHSALGRLRRDHDLLSVELSERLGNHSGMLLETLPGHIGKLNSSVDKLSLLQSHDSAAIESLGTNLRENIQPQLYLLHSNMTAWAAQSSANGAALNATVTGVLTPLNDHVRGFVDSALSNHSRAIGDLQKDKVTLHAMTSLFTNISTTQANQYSNRLSELQGQVSTTDRSLTNITVYVDRLVNKMEFVVNNSLVTYQAENERLQGDVSSLKGIADSVVVNSTRYAVDIATLSKQVNGDLNARVEANSLATKANEDKLSAHAAVAHAEIDSKFSALEKKQAAHNNDILTMQEKMMMLELKLTNVEKRVETLGAQYDKLRSEMATQDSVDGLRKLLYDMQSSMIAHSNKVLDVIVSSKGSGDGAGK